MRSALQMGGRHVLGMVGQELDGFDLCVSGGAACHILCALVWAVTVVWARVLYFRVFCQLPSTPISLSISISLSLPHTHSFTYVLLYMDLIAFSDWSLCTINCGTCFCTMTGPRSCSVHHHTKTQQPVNHSTVPEIVNFLLSVCVQYCWYICAVNTCAVQWLFRDGNYARACTYVN